MDEQVGTRRDDVLLLVVAVAAALVFLVIVAVGLATRSSATSPASGDATSRAGASSVDVKLAEYRVELPATRLTHGIKQLRISNDGTIDHELLVFRSDLAPAAYPLDKGDINEEGPGVTKISDGEDVAPGASQRRSVDLSKPGTYLFVCNLPGHFAQGMYTTVTVG
jgi:uncharacterized cupredoxin-like copper-binding protein